MRKSTKKNFYAIFHFYSYAWRSWNRARIRSQLKTDLLRNTGVNLPYCTVAKVQYYSICLKVSSTNFCWINSQLVWALSLDEVRSFYKTSDETNFYKKSVTLTGQLCFSSLKLYVMCPTLKAYEYVCIILTFILCLLLLD